MTSLSFNDLPDEIISTFGKYLFFQDQGRGIIQVNKRCRNLLFVTFKKEYFMAKYGVKTLRNMWHGAIRDNEVCDYPHLKAMGDPGVSFMIKVTEFMSK